MPNIDNISKLNAIQSVVCCPQCRGDIAFRDKACCHEVILAADLHCQNCGGIGKIRNTKFIFNDNPSFRIGGPGFLGGRLSLVSQTSISDVHFPSGKWVLDHGRYWTDEPGSAFCIETEAVGVNISLLKHSWAGIVEFRVDGNVLGSLDLFEANGSIEVSIPVFLGTRPTRLEVVITGEKNAGSSSNQCHVCRFEELLVLPSTSNEFLLPSINRGNPYPTIWNTLVEEMPPDSLILDCGSGDRRYPDPRVINFEYGAFGLPDAFGDSHHLPFKDNTFDLVLSQAVIEHLYNPFDAVHEIRRVLKPNGKIYAESAFMQPLHAVPFHFFNTTRWGIEKLFENFSIEGIGDHGCLHDTLSWIYSLTSLREQGMSETLDKLLLTVRDLDRFIDENTLRKFASYVSITARKPC